MSRACQQDCWLVFNIARHIKFNHIDIAALETLSDRIDLDDVRKISLHFVHKLVDIREQQVVQPILSCDEIIIQRHHVCLFKLLEQLALGLRSGLSYRLLLLRWSL